MPSVAINLDLTPIVLTPIVPIVCLNFNHKHQKIKLAPEHFTPDGENVTASLIQQIESIDPGWKVKGAEPVFEETATKKRIKISEHTLGHIDKPREVTFHSVMDGGRPQI